jgi:hypothetical protein
VAIVDDDVRRRCRRGRGRRPQHPPGR